MLVLGTLAGGAHVAAQDDDSSDVLSKEERAAEDALKEREYPIMTEAVRRSNELWKANDVAGRVKILEDAAAQLTFPLYKATVLLFLADTLRNQGRSVSARDVLAETESIVRRATEGKKTDGWNVRTLCYLRGVEAQIYVDWGLVDIAYAKVEQLAALNHQLAETKLAMDGERVQFNYVKAFVLSAMQDCSGLERHVAAVINDPVYARYAADAGLLHERLGVALKEEARTKPEFTARARAELELSLSDQFKLTDSARVLPELFLADLALRESDLQTAQSWFEKATQHVGKASDRATHPRGTGWAAIAARLAFARKTPPDRAELEEARSRLEEILRARLDAWRSTELRRGGYGILRYQDVRSLISELVRVDIALEPGRAGVERALSRLIETDEVGTLARSLGATSSSLSRARVELLAGKPDHALLWYFRASDRSHLFVVGQDSAEHFELPGADFIDLARLDAVEVVQRPADARGPGADLDQLLGGGSAEATRARRETSSARAERRSAALRTLASLLLPIEARPLLEKSTRITVVGLDLFDTVPFEALPWSDTSTLGASKAIAHLPSLAAGLVLAQRARNEVRVRASELEDGVLFVASPKASGLEIAAERLRNVLDAYPSSSCELLAGADASFEGLQRSVSAARVLQVLTHGRYEIARERPATLLLEDSTSKGGRFVGADEIERIDVPPLAIFSGCGAGRAPVRRGDGGAADLAGATFLAGRRARCVVMSSFDLDAKAALRTSSIFHTELAKGTDPAEAMRIASAELSRDPDFADPFYHGLVRVVGIGHVPLFAR